MLLTEGLQPACVQNQVLLGIHTTEIRCLTVAVAQFTRQRNPQYQPHVSPEVLVAYIFPGLGYIRPLCFAAR